MVPHQHTIFSGPNIASWEPCSRFSCIDCSIVCATGLGFSRWATEAMLVEEFKRYDYYMQPRIHLIMAEVSSSAT